MQRQDGLVLPVPALLGRAAGGVSLDQVQLAQRRVLLLAVGELAGQRGAVQGALAPDGLAGLAGGMRARAASIDLASDPLGDRRVLLEEDRRASR